MPNTYLLAEIETSALAAGETHATIARSRCSRRGRLSLAKLIERHGPSLPAPDLLRLLVGDCPQRDDIALHARCPPHMPELARWIEPRPST